MGLFGKRKDGIYYRKGGKKPLTGMKNTKPEKLRFGLTELKEETLAEKKLRIQEMRRLLGKPLTPERERELQRKIEKGAKNYNPNDPKTWI